MASLGSSLAVRRFAFLGAAVVLGAVVAQAQSGTFTNSSDEVAVSSSAASFNSDSSSNDVSFNDSSSAEPAAPAHGGGQYDNRSKGGGGGRHYAFEAGGGFNAPVGNDIPYITWGGNFTVGGGLRFSKAFTLLAEYQFIADKLPGALVAAGGGQTGNAHIQSITIAPV